MNTKINHNVAPMVNDKTLYHRKLNYAKSLGFNAVWEAIFSMGDHRKFNKKFNEVQHLF